MKNSISLRYFAPTIAKCLGVDAANNLDESALPLLEDFLKENNCINVERTFIYNPDAIGMWLTQKYTENFNNLLKNTKLSLPVVTEMPSVTPVCFGTMYTGLSPKEHGITKYEKKVIERESLFDKIYEAKKKVAIVAVENSSMATIFSGKLIDYYILKYDEEVNEKAKELIIENKYDVIVVYNQEYDDVMHRTGPESEESLRAMRNHINAFSKFVDLIKENWTNYNSFICCATDHGIHEEENGRGTHGYDIEEDLNIVHYFNAIPKKKEV